MKNAWSKRGLIALIFIPIAFSVAAQDLNAMVGHIEDLKGAGKYDAALVEAKKFEELVRQNGTENRNYAIANGTLGSVLQLQGKYAEAEPYLKNALAIFDKVEGANGRDVAMSLNGLGELYDAQGRFADAEPLLKRALTINEQSVRDPVAIAETLSNLAYLYFEQGRYGEAEPLYKRALAIVEKFQGAESQNVAATLGDLANVYDAEGKFADAEPLLKRAVDIYGKLFGTEHAAYASALSNLATLYHGQRRFSEAEPLKKRVLAIDEKFFGENNLQVSKDINNLAAVYDDEGHYADAEPLYRKSIAIQEKLLGPDHPTIALALGNFANCYMVQKRYADAEPLLKRALDIRRKTLAAGDANLIVSLNDMGRLYLLQGQYDKALEYARQATSAIIEHTFKAQGGTAPSSDGGASEWQIIPFVNHVAALAGAAKTKPEANAQLGSEAFVMGQWSEQSAAANAVQQMAARTAAGTGSLAAIVRKNQDLTAQWKDLDKRIITAASKSHGNPATIDALRKDIDSIESQLSATKAELDKDFPGYATLTHPQPITVDDTEKLLGPDEALVTWVVADNVTTVFAVTHESFEWHRAAIGKKDLSAKVGSFRRGLSIDELRNSITATQTSALFDAGLAYELYETLFEPVDALIKSKHQLIVAPFGVLTGLPMHLLVTEKPAIAIPDDTNLQAYRNTAWLLKRQAISVLPSVASLKALRSEGAGNAAAKPLVGFGNPTFRPGPILPSTPARKFAAATRSYSDYWSGNAINRDALASGLPPLPATADELKAVAADVGAPTNDVYLGPVASETTVKSIPLANYRIVYFATHALVAGDITGLGEPALALALPKTPTSEDDGLLTASEVAELKLNADWVVLSACNTAAGDKPGAEALSGLARSFFYAGARAMLVSHWDVDSDAATRLMTSTFDIMKADPKMGKAEALRQAMLKYIGNTSDPWSAHPAFWAPFSLIGDGR